MMRQLTLHLPVSQCSCCGGDHDSVRFVPVANPVGGRTHAGVCPVTGTEFRMDTQSQPGVWERLLKAARETA